MIKRYDTKVLKKNIAVKIIIGVLVMLISIAGFVLIENNEEFNKLYIQIILLFLFFLGGFIFALIGKDLRKLDNENRLEEIEKYILECDSYISMLYKMHLNNELVNKLTDINIHIFSNYPIMWEDEYVIEIIKNDKKLIIQFYENIIMYAIVKIDKYEFDINEAKWNEINNFEFNNEEQIIEFISSTYKKLDSNK